VIQAPKDMTQAHKDTNEFTPPSITVLYINMIRPQRQDTSTQGHDTSTHGHDTSTRYKHTRS